MSGRLTEAQYNTLSMIDAYNGAPYGNGRDFPAPVRRLLRRRLLATKPHPHPMHRSNCIIVYATDAGRRALAEREDGE